MADFESVGGRNGSRETGANLDRICCFNPFQVWSKGKRDRDQKRCAVAETKKSPQNPWTESWFSRAKRENGSAKNVWSRGRSWGEKFWRREILTSLLNRSNRSLNLNDFRYIKQVDGQSRLKEIKISLYGEFELRNGLFQENHARDCQEIEEMRKLCCEETDRARQAKLDALSMPHEMNPTTVSQLLTQILDLQNKFLVWENVTILKQRAALEHPTFPFNSLPFWVPEPCLASILDCRMIHGILWVLQETFLNDHLFKKYDPPKSSPILKTFGIILSGIETWNCRKYKEKRVKWKENRWNTRKLVKTTQKSNILKWEGRKELKIQILGNRTTGRYLRTLQAQGHLCRQRLQGLCFTTWSTQTINTWRRSSTFSKEMGNDSRTLNIVDGSTKTRCVEMGECACLRRWKPPSILGRIIWRIRRCTTTRTSREFRAHPISHR